MKRLYFLLAALAACAAMAGCARGTAESPPPITQLETPVIEVPDGGIAAAGVVMRAKIIACGETDLLVANKEEGGLYSLSIDTPMEGSKKLAPGQIVDIGYDGTVQESYPAILSAPSFIKVVEQEADLVGLYQTVFLDLLKKDQGLNDSVDMLAFDLTKAENLTEGEKSALLYQMQTSTGLETFLGAFKELESQGLISDNEGFKTFDKGLLLSLEVTEQSQGGFKFNADKFRSSLGAYFFMDCTATGKGPDWAYTIGGEAIS